jgi:hypothetical protein
VAEGGVVADDEASCFGSPHPAISPIVMLARSNNRIFMIVRLSCLSFFRLPPQPLPGMPEPASFLSHASLLLDDLKLLI